MTEEHWRRLEAMYRAAPINRFVEATLSITEGRATIGVQVKPEFFHAMHATHGAICFKVLDDAAFFAVNSLVEDVFVLTSGFQIYLLRPVARGTITATGTVVNRSRRLFVAEAVAVDDDGREVARGSGTFLRSEAKLSDADGYGDELPPA